MPKATDPILNEWEAEGIGQPAGTPLRNLSAEALRALASKYLDAEIAVNFVSKYYGCASSESWLGCLDTLAPLMGEEAFRAVLAEKRSEWEQMCAEADADLRALPPCVTCGGPRNLVDAYERSDMQCGACYLTAEE
jgi:hypothetical protein